MNFAKSIVVVLAMLAATAGAAFLKPTKLISELQPHPPLEEIVPKSFKDWQVDPHVAPLAIDPSLEKTLSEIYSQTLTRTYVNSRGQRVMLSIAYGANQSRDLQLHRPEVCYAAQGFQIGQITKEQFPIASVGTVQSKTLVAVNGGRVEPITYWMRVGDRLVVTGLEQMLTRYEYGLKGYIPDGLLFRVSNISGDRAESQRLQADFVGDLYQAIAVQNRPFIFGRIETGGSTNPGGS